MHSTTHADDDLEVEVGGSTVTITDPTSVTGGDGGEFLPGADGIVVVEFEGAAADAAVDGASAGQDEITLASAVVDIVIGDDGNLTVSCADGKQCVNVSFVVASAALSLTGLDACVVPTIMKTLLRPQEGRDEACVTGRPPLSQPSPVTSANVCAAFAEQHALLFVRRCCVESDGSTECECDSDEVRGPKCEQRLRCSAQREAGGERDFDACSTDASGGDNVVCQCEEFRRIAVFAHKAHHPFFAARVFSGALCIARSLDRCFRRFGGR